MFSQKKKKSKGWLFFIPLTAVFIIGLWMNAFFEAPEDVSEESTTVSGEYKDRKDNMENNSNEIPIFEYADNTGSDDGAESTDNTGNAESTESADNTGGNDRDDNSDVSYSGDEDSSDEDSSDENVADSDNEYSDAEDEKDEKDEKDMTEGFLADYFLVKEEGGKVYIREFRNGKIKKSTETEIIPEMLPDYDRRSLEKGMIMLTEDEVESLLENFEG